MGDIILTPDGVQTTTRKLADYAVDAGYARQIIPWLSAGLTLRYISIARAEQGGVVSSGAFAADASVYYQQTFNRHTVTAGLSLLNIGDKVDTGGADASLPASVNLGAGWTLETAEAHRTSVLFNIAQPLTAARAGETVSLQQAAWSAGLEYGFRQRLFARLGYLYSAREYDDMSYLSFGAGVRLGSLSVDAAYLLSAADRESAIVNTLRITVGFAFGQSNDIMPDSIKTKRTWKPLRKSDCKNCPY
jgi:opacity protein-like surface antigen